MAFSRSAIYAHKYGRRNGRELVKKSDNGRVNNFAASTKRKISPGHLHFSFLIFFFKFIVYVLRIRSPADFKGATLMLYFSPAELTDRTSMRYFTSRFKFVLPVL